MKASPASVLASCRDLVMRRWMHLLAAIGITAVVDGVLWMVASKLLSRAGSDSSSVESGPPSMVGLAMLLTLVWAILVAILALPMLAATSALTDDEESPVGWISGSLHAAPAMWIRLAIPTLPLLLLGLWMLNGLLSVFADVGASVASGVEPSNPLSFTVGDVLLGNTVGRTLVFAAVLGSWYLWSTTHATRTEQRLLPSAPWRLHGRSPLAVGGLVAVSSIVLGPVLSRALEGLGSGLVPTEGAGGDGTGTMAIVILGFVIAAFVGTMAVPWIALYGDDPEPRLAGDGASPGPALADPVGAVGAAAATGAAEPVATLTSAPAPAATPVPQVSDLQLTSQPGQLTGAWWYLRAGAQAFIQVAGRDGAPPPTPATLDAASQWQALQPAQQPGAAMLTAPTDGWYQLGAWVGDPLPTQVAIRLTLPADAQPAPQHHTGTA